MASFRKLSGGRWRAEVARQGVRKSKICENKQAARDWAARQEYLILHEEPKTASAVPFRDVMKRYANEISPGKKGERWECLRLNRFQKDAFAELPVSELEPHHFAAWRDQRLREVAAGTVNREMTLLSGVLTVARKEWGLIAVNPITDVRKPSKPPPRDRIATPHEMECLALSAGADLTKSTARAFHAFRFAVETAMRAGEIVGLEWERVNLDERFCELPKTKNGTARKVALSSAAVALLEALPRQDPVFGLKSGTLDALWRKLRDRAAVVDLTFHDSRHMAITHLAQKLDPLDLARMVGHRDLRELLTYYNPTAADIAKRLG